MSRGIKRYMVYMMSIHSVVVYIVYRYMYIDTPKHDISYKMNDIYMYDDNNMVYNEDYVYSGQYTQMYKANSTSNDIHERGSVVSAFRTNPNNPKDVQLVVNILEGEYSDNRKIGIRLYMQYGDFNSTDTSYRFDNTNVGYLRLDYINHLTYIDSKYSTSFSIVIHMLNSSSHLPFDLNASDVMQNDSEVPYFVPDVRLLTIRFDVQVYDYDINIYGDMRFGGIEDTHSIQMKVYLFLSGICLYMIVEGSNKIEDSDDYYMLSNTSYLSLLMITIIHFQYVGGFVLFMVLGKVSVVMFFIFASIVTTFSTIFIYRSCFIVFMYNYLTHPLIDIISCRSPRMIFTIASLVLLVVFYTSSIFIIGTKYYSYYLMVLHSYPLVHVWNSVRRGTRCTFNKYIQIYIWWPSSLFAIMLRGYDGNILDLEPSYLMTAYILFVLVSCTVLSYMQSVKGPYFFLPDWCSQGYRKMIIPLSKVPEDKLYDDCYICYSMIVYDPIDGDVELQEVSGASSTKLKEELLGKKANKKVMKTPCNHYFHINCLTTWIEKKQECPACKTKLSQY